MKIHFNIDGWEFHYEREQLKDEQFNTVCLLVGIYLVGSGILKLMSILFG